MAKESLVIDDLMGLGCGIVVIDDLLGLGFGIVVIDDLLGLGFGIVLPLESNHPTNENSSHEKHNSLHSRIGNIIRPKHCHQK